MEAVKMEIIKLLIALAVQPILCWMFIMSIKAGIFILEEINHTCKNLKREFKQGIWDLEWQLKLMKGK